MRRNVIEAFTVENKYPVLNTFSAENKNLYQKL
jgi:hypothetical protein